MDSRKISPLNSARSALMLVLLIILGFVGNYFSMPLYFGVEFLFGSIAVLVVTRLYGLLWGTAAAAIAGSYTYYLLNHPYTLLIFVLEALAVGTLLRIKSRNIILADTLYWIFMGIPLSYFLNLGVLEITAMASHLIVYKQVVNGIFNALAAGLILSYLPLPIRKWAGYVDKKEPVTLLHTIFNVVTAMVLVTAFIFTTLDNIKDINEIETNIKNRLEAKSSSLVDNLNSWYKEHQEALIRLGAVAAENGVRPSPELQHMTESYQQALNNFKRVHIDDSSGTSITFAPPAENGIPTIGQNFSNRPYYKELKSTLKPVISDLFIGRIGNPSPIVTLGVPILIDENFSGYVIGAVEQSYITNQLKAATKGETMDVTVLDSQGLVISSTRHDLTAMDKFDHTFGIEDPHPDDGIYYWKPPARKNVPEVLRWSDSFYVKEVKISQELPWRLIVEVPVAPYQSQLQKNNIQRLEILLTVSILGIFAAHSISRRLANPINSLAKVTTNLPRKLLHQKEIQWPESSVTEIGFLVSNFRYMAQSLQENFMALWNEKERANDLLKQMVHLAHHDPLTGLPNRIMFSERLNQALKNARIRKEHLAVLFFDLDQFKNVNDIFGHAVGDNLLKEVTSRLNSCLRESDTIARMGGDEFTMLVPCSEDGDEATGVSGKVLKVLQQPWIINGHEFHITASIGIAIYPIDGNDAETLVKHADIAMYRAKEQGRNNYQLFTQAMNIKIMERQSIENKLRHALDRNQFVIHYQPMVNTFTGEIIGMEALLRWHHPELGLVMPADFIPVAEETGLIVPIGEWVLDTACSQTKAWQDQGLPPFRIMVNLSACQFRQHNLAYRISQILDETGLDPGWLELEVTETTAMYDADFTIETLNRLRSMGIRIALDDFGTGYSSLNYLRRFPLTTIKVDRSFVCDVLTDKDDAAVVRAIIVMAKNLSLNIIIEGVETLEHQLFFEELDCFEMQGYLFGRPKPSDEVELMLRETGYIRYIAAGELN